jgi:general secretion pathway protein J
MTHVQTGVARDDAGEAGFTLVELLVGLALFSVLATLLFDNVRFGINAWQLGSAHAEQFEHDLIAQDLLRRLIGNVYPMLVLDGATQRLDFDGDKETVSFLGDAPVVTNGGGRFRYRVLVERQHDRTDLIMSAAPELANPQGAALARRTVLLSDIDRAEFSYFGDSEAEQALQWQDSWRQRVSMPRLMRIRVAFRSADARAWPDLLIAPRITADVGCVYDPMTRRCRGR